MPRRRDNTSIVNRALAAIGTPRNRAAIDQHMADALAYGTSALHIGIDPAAPNGDHSVVCTATTATNAEGGSTMTIETLQRARELMMREGLPAYGHSPAMDALPAMRELNEQMRRNMMLGDFPVERNMTATEIMERTRNRGREQPLVDIEFETYHPTNQIQVRTRIRELHRMTLLDREQIVPENFEHIAREAAIEFSRALEADIMRALIQAHENSNRGRYANHGIAAGIAAGMARHMDDMVLRTMFDRNKGGTGAFAWLKDFKYKSITHNGWTAKVLDSYEAVAAEGKDMSHCLGGAYVNRIAEAKYMAVHITAPEGSKLPKSGFTLGFHKQADTLAFDQIKGKKNDMHHCQHSGLLWFVNMIENVYKGGRIPADAVVA